MAISSYPTPADAGVLCIILANTTIFISMVKVIRIGSWEELHGKHGDILCTLLASGSLDGRSSRPTPRAWVDVARASRSCAWRSSGQILVIRFESLSIHDDYPGQECSICLSEFEPNAEVNHLTCGHVFHNMCREKCLNYWNTTCPLCCNCMMPHESEEKNDEDTCTM